MAILVRSFTSASQRMCIVVKGICERTWNLPRMASSSFFISLILPGSRTYDRTFRIDDRFSRLFTSADTEFDIFVSSLKIECQHHSNEGCGRELCTRWAPWYSASIVLMILLNQSDYGSPIAMQFRQPSRWHSTWTRPTLSCSPGSPYMNSQQKFRLAFWIHATYFDITCHWEKWFHDKIMLGCQIFANRTLSCVMLSYRTMICRLLGQDYIMS